MKYDVVIFSDSKYISGRPYGMYRIASELRGLGHTVKTVWNFILMSDIEFIKCIAKFVSQETKVLGISASIMNDPWSETNNYFFGVSDESLRFRLNFIKKKFPKIKIVMGGAQVSAADEKFLKQYGDVIDYFVTGQGEEIIKQLLTNDQIKTKEIYGLKFISDKDYPYVNFNNSINLLTEDDNILPNEALPLEVSRGCIFACAFCNFDLVGKKVTDFTRIAENMKNEVINNYEKFGTTHYYVIDDLINDSSFKVSLLEEVVNNLPFNISFTGYNRLDLYWRFPELAKRLMDIGFKSAMFGIETINDASGKVVGKGLGKQRIEETLYKIRDIWKDNVAIEATFILGLPYDTRETAPELGEWLSKCIDDKIFQLVRINPLNLSPYMSKTPMFQNPEKYGYKFNITDSYDGNRGNFLNYWDKGDYTYLEAKEDSTKVFNQCKEKLVYADQIMTFNLPYYLSLFKSKEEEKNFFRCFMHNLPYGSDINFLRKLSKEHRQNYMKKLLL